MTTPAAFEGDVLIITAMIVFLAFAIDRIVSILLFLFSFNRWWGRKFPEPTLQKSAADRFRADKRHKLVYFLLAGVLTTGILIYADKVRVLSALGFESLKAPPVIGGSTTAGTTESQSTTTLDKDKNKERTRAFKILDFVTTALILVGGADRLEQFLKLRSSSGTRETAESKPLEITGKITLDDQSGTKGQQN